jgi:hypothetical protein
VQDRHDVAESTSSDDERPSWACVLCPPLRNGGWVQRDTNFATCSGCYDRLREALTEVSERFLLLDSRPGAFREHGSRGAPGFRSPICSLGSGWPATVACMPSRNARRRRCRPC